MVGKQQHEKSNSIAESTENSKSLAQQWIKDEYNRGKEAEAVYKKMKADTEQSWTYKHPTAHMQLPQEWEPKYSPETTATRNTKSLHVFAGGYFVGPWLQGRIFKHCRLAWEVKLVQLEVSRFCKSKELAEEMLLQFNARHRTRVSINRWKIHLDEDDIKDNTHSIKIMLTGDRYFLVSDDDDILDALSKYQWRDTYMNNDDDFDANSYKAVRVDKSGAKNGWQRHEWKKAQDLVLFTMLKKLKQPENRKDEICIDTIADYRDFVVIDAIDTATNDYRANKLRFHFEKTALKSQQDENKEAPVETYTSRNREREVQLSNERSRIVKKWTNHSASTPMDIETMLNKINREYASFLRNNVHGAANASNASNASSASAAAAAETAAMLD